MMMKSAEQLVGKPFAGLLADGDVVLKVLDRVFRTQKTESHTEQQRSGPHQTFRSCTIWPMLEEGHLARVVIQVTRTAGFHEKILSMNEELMLGSVRQHELTEAADLANDRLHKEITERKHAEAALRESERRYRTLFELGPVAVYSCDAAGVIQKFNRRANALWGCKPASGDTCEHFCTSMKLFHPDGRSMTYKQSPMARVVSGKPGDVRDAEMLIERSDGARRTVLVNIRVLKNKQGEVAGAIHCFHDITERKEAEKAKHRLEVLSVSNRKLEAEIVRRRRVERSLKKSEQRQRLLLLESSDMRDRQRLLSRQLIFVQEDERKRISRELHDVIAQTLSGISLRLSALKADATNTTPEHAHKIARTQHMVEESMRIVHKFARELRPAVLDDHGLIPALRTFVKGFNEETGIHVAVSAFAAVERIDGDKRTMFFRVIQEALANVARHAFSNRVEIRIQKVDGTACLSIKDNGRGFEDGKPRTKRQKRLGLLGMRERAEMVGGDFAIKSAKGRGTTISVTVPLQKVRVRRLADAMGRRIEKGERIRGTNFQAVVPP